MTGPVTMYAEKPRGHAGLPDLSGQRLEPQASRLPRRTNRYASSDDCRARCGLRPAGPQRAQPGTLGECSVWGATDRRPLPARKLAGNYAQSAQACQDSASGIVDACGAPDPRTLTGWTGASPHVLRFPRRAFLRVSRLPAGFFPFLRLPLVSLRQAFSGSVPSAVARFRFPFGFPPGSLPLSDLHGSAAAWRFPQALVPDGSHQGHQ